MAQSSNYKPVARQTRTLTEETAFAGGMLWTGNNIDEMHLKTIINFNYDETTGYLKTRDPFLLKDNTSRYIERASNIYGDYVENAPELKTIDGLFNKILIGAYNICYIDTIDDPNGALSKAGWLYVFGSPNINADGYATCLESTLTFVYKDYNNKWHKLIPDWITEEAVPCSLIGSAGITPILYDNILYCTTDESNTAFNAYGIYNATVALTPSTKGGDTPPDEVVYYITKQSYDATEPNVVFKNNIKDLVNSVTLLEASSTGFNALRGKDMFKYEGTVSSSADSIKSITGVYLTDETDNICVTPRIGQEVTVNIVLNNVLDGPKPNDPGMINLYKLYSGSIENNNAVWSLVDSCKVTATTATFKVVITEDTTLFKVEWLVKSDPPPKPTELPEIYDTLIVTYSANKLNTQSKLKPYKLDTAVGSCLWNGHLVLWGAEESPNILFISEVDNFYYMPVPNNVALFETNIIGCIPYLGSLLVFTADRIYRLSEDKNGGFIQEVVQNNMPLAKEDAPYLRAIKNMVFFRSGKYYYMVVPKAQSLTGELVVAPIYKNLAKWFDDPDIATEEILSQLYPDNHYESSKDNKSNHAIQVHAPTDVFVEQDTVTLLYNVTANCSTYINKKHFIGNGTTFQYTLDPKPYGITTLTINNRTMVAGEDYTYAQGVITFAKAPDDKAVIEIIYDANYLLPPIQQSFALFVNYNTNLRAWTMYIEETTHAHLYPAALTASRQTAYTKVTSDDALSIVTMQDSTNTQHGIPCLIDTGYRTLATSFKKRFRELQLKLYSVTENLTTFGSAFYVDGNVRKSYTTLKEAYTASDVNEISLTPVYDPNTFIIEKSNTVLPTGTTVIDAYKKGSDSIELSNWTLDFSHFKRGAPTTIRVPVSGKGYAPRFIFNSTQCIALYINEINWVYRIMNGR